MTSFISLVAAIALVATTAFAADAPPAAKPAAAASTAKPGSTDKKTNPEEKLICTRETSTDSFLSKRVCRTKAQIDADRRAAEQLDNDRQLMNGRPDQVQGR